MTPVCLTKGARMTALRLSLSTLLLGLAGPAAAAQSGRWSTTPAAVAPRPPLHARPAPIVTQAAAKDVRPSRVTLSLNLQQSWQLDDGSRLFGDERNVGGGGLQLACRLVDLSDRLSLHALVDWQAEQSEGRWLLGDTKLENHALAAGVMLRYEARWWLAPFLRVAGGVNLAKARLDHAGPTLGGEVSAPFSMAGLGLSFRTWPYQLGQRGPQLRLSFDIEGGFTLARDLDLALRPTGLGGDDEAVPFDPVPLGAVGRSRPHLRFSLAVHF